MTRQEIIKQIDDLNKQLHDMDKKEKTIKFLELLSSVLRNDLCEIKLTGHNEWQFQEKYLMSDIRFEQRNCVARKINEIVKELKENV